MVINLDEQVRVVCLVRLQTDNFRLFLRQQKDKLLFDNKTVNIYM